MSDVISDFESMSREELIEVLLQREEGIRITFSGKDNAKRLARKVQPRSSRRIAKYSLGDEEQQAKNLVIEGENLQAMVTLYRERGQVDLILTDPPYNTGKDFRYNDRWEDDPNDPDLGDLVLRDDVGRHTKWMKFMWPRLKVMRDMLKPTGVLAICIDHRELFRLGPMMNEVFGEDNRLAMITWQRSATRRNDKDGVFVGAEYLLVYAKDKARSNTGLEGRTEAQDAGYKDRDNDPLGRWVGVIPFAPGAKTHPGMVYAVQHPFTGELIYPPGTSCWKAEKPTIKKWFEGWGSTYVERDLQDGLRPALLLKGSPDPRTLRQPSSHPVVAAARKKAEKVMKGDNWPMIVFTRKGFGTPRKKTYLDQVKKGVVPSTYWADEDYASPITFEEDGAWASSLSGTTEVASRELTEIVGDHGFETVKPLKLFKKIIQLWCPPSGLVLDPFAGSGTTGHAVLSINDEVETDRRFILVEQGRPERGDPYARSLLSERLRRVVSGDWKAGPQAPVDGGYRFVQLQKRVDAKALLEMERDEMTDAVIASHYESNRRGGPGLVMMTLEGYEYLVARNADGEGFFLAWNGSEHPPVFDDDVYDAVVSEALKANLKPVYHVYARFNLFQSDDVHFYQIPDRILMDFGLQANDAFNNGAEE